MSTKIPIKQNCVQRSEDDAEAGVHHRTATRHAGFVGYMCVNIQGAAFDVELDDFYDRHNVTESAEHVAWLTK